MTTEREPIESLEDEGMPDLDDDLPSKAATGDPQEGIPQPGDRPRASRDWGTTPAEGRAGEPHAIRLEREVLDKEPRPEEPQIRLVAPEHGGDPDAEGMEIAEEAFEGEHALTAEEEAVRVDPEETE